MERRSNWRDLKEWASCGLPFSTTSDEACKLLDAALTQYVGSYNDPTMGGLTETLSNLLNADPTAVIGHVLSLGLEILCSGQTPLVSTEFRKKLKILVDLSTGKHVTDWERLHVKGVTLLADGHVLAACNVWEDILLAYPLDLIAIKFAYDMSIYVGTMPERRDMIARVLPHWTSSIPLYSYIYGMYCFSLCETNEFAKAEIFGKKGLEINPRDSWSTHSLVHTYDMTGRHNESSHLLESTVKYWEQQQGLACHNYWHWSLTHVEKSDYQDAIGIFDSELYPRTKSSRSGFNVSDCSALLKRLEMEGVSVGERWNDLFEVCRDDVEYGNNFPIADAHYMMCVLGAKQRDVAQKMIDNIREFIKSGNTHSHSVKQEVGAVICQSLMAYDEGDYSTAVDLLYPIRYKIYMIGGSNAQRDVIHQFLIHAAMKSTDPLHNKMARSLLVERKAKIEDSPLTDRLIERALAVH